MDKKLITIFSTYSELVKRPETYLSVQNDSAVKLKKTIKDLYDLTKSVEEYEHVKDSLSTDALPELIIDNFDDEQVWQELELQNDPIISGLLGSMSRLAAAPVLSLRSNNTAQDTTHRKHKMQHAKKKKESENSESETVSSESESDNKDTTDINVGNSAEEVENIEENDSESDDEDIMDLMKSVGKQTDYNSDDSEEERMLKELLEKGQDAAVGEGEESSDEDLSDNNDFGIKEDDLDYSDFLDKKRKSKIELMEEEIADDAEDQVEQFAFGSTRQEDGGEFKPSQFGKLASDKNENSEINSRKISGNKQRRTVVDDKFFSLADMESFLEVEDQREDRRIAKEKGEVKNDSDESSEEDEYEMLYGDYPDEDVKAEKEGLELKYKDFFGSPGVTLPGEASKDADDNSEQQMEEHDSSSNDSSEDEEAPVEEEVMDSESEGEDVKDILGGSRGKTPSTYEKRQDKLKKKIGELEEAAIDEKPWQLAGEASATSRPLNSLLEETLEFEQQTRAAPALTEETTKTLEDIIKQRIKDKSFDDVERKDKPKEEVFEYRKRIALDQEKSKLSLGQVYEQEYLKQQQEEEEEKKDPIKEEVTKMMTSLFVKLDALSNFHYTPKPAAPEVKIISNLPSINMEEVLPVAVSDKTMLAPEEIKNKGKREMKGDTEKSKTDKQRERKDKKRKQRSRQKAKEKREKLLEKIAPGLGNKFHKKNAMKELEKQSKSGKSVSVIEDKKEKKNKNLTSSKQFFTQLQEEATAHIADKIGGKVKKQKKTGQSVTKLKL